MIPKSSAIFLELNSKLKTIASAAEDSLECCRQSIKTVAESKLELKAIYDDYNFKDTEEEIEFFKNIKPKFIAKLIYYKKIYAIESRRPLGSEKVQRDYLNQEFDKLTQFFHENYFLYDYFRQKSVYMDTKMYTRDNQPLEWKFDSGCYDTDLAFSTSTDHQLAVLLANESIQDYLTDKITKLESWFNNPLQYKITKLKWTGTNSQLVEAIYAFYAAKVFNYGKVDIKEIVAYFELIFDIDLGKFYGVFNEIKTRKKNYTIFLDLLKECLLKKIQEKDYN